MSQRLTKVRVFLASPSDVQEERSLLDGVVAELNRSVAHEVDVVLELVKWETHSRPGVGEDAQDVINQQLGRCDIFIGIMWKRIGTPTLRAGSGTVEEYQRAWRTLNEPRGKHAPLLFYFCTRPFFPNSEDDLTQMQSVMRFRHDLEKQGLLVGIYETTKEFEDKIHEHLTMTVLDWAGRNLDQFIRPKKSKAEQKKARILLNTAETSREIEAALAEGAAVGVIFFDLDRFTLLNDKYGRELIDKYLQELMMIVSDAIAGKGRLIHYFGDEFIIVMPNTSTGEVIATAERLRQTIGNYDPFGTNLKVTASFGVISIEGHSPPEKLIQDLRKAVFVSKIKGKNTVTALPLPWEDEILIQDRLVQRKPS